MVETFLHFSNLAQLPALGLLVYIAFMAGRQAQRVTGLEKRMGNIERRFDNLIEGRS